MANASLKGLVGHWPLDEGQGTTTRDRSPNGLDGSIHGAKWVDDANGQVLEFQPNGSWIEIPHDPKLDIGQDITISAWVWKRASNDAKRWDGVVTKGPVEFVEPDHIRYELMLSQVNSDEIAFFAGSATPPAAWSGRAVPAREWTHIAFVRKGDVGQFYLNGAPTERYRIQLGKDPGHLGEGEGFLVTNVEFAGVMESASPDSNLYIGWDGNAGHGMDGRIRDVYLYDRALDDEEMKTLSGV